MFKKPITKKNIADFNEFGYLKIKNFVDKNILKKCKKEIYNKIHNKYKKFYFYYEKSLIKNKKLLRRIENVTDVSNFSKKLILSKDMQNIISRFAKGNKFYLFKDKVNLKYPGGKGFGPHIDGHFYWKDKSNKLHKGWKEYGNKFINVVIPLENTDLKNGCIKLSSKKDTFKVFGKSWNLISKNLITGTPYLKKKDFKKFKFKSFPLKVGDVLFFDYRICHKSNANYSKKSRMIFYATFVENDNVKNGKKLRKKYYQDKKSSINSIQQKSLL